MAKRNKNDLASQEAMNNFNQDATSSYHIIVQVEFDGKNPGGTYYDRLHAMGIYVNKGNREEYSSPLTRRHNAHHNPQALVLNEGMFSCSNEDVARRIANLADECGAAVVTIGRYYSTVYRVNNADLTAYETYKKGVSKRGPKAASEKGIYTITCFHEVRTFEVELEAYPMACQCGSVHYSAHFGEGKHYVKPSADKDGDVFDYWLRSRFGAGAFEIPMYTKGKHMPPLTVKNKPTLPKLDVSPELLADMDADFNFTLHVWDIVYSLTKFTEVERLNGRLDVINVFIHEGGTKTLYMGLTDDVFDVLDLSILDKDLMRYI